MRPPDFERLGARLIKGNDALACGLRQIQRESPGAGQEVRAFERLENRLDRTAQKRWVVPVMSTVVAIAIAIAVVAVFGLWLVPSQQRPTASTTPTEEIPVLRQLDEQSRPLAPGTQGFDDGTLVRLSDVGQAKVRRLSVRGIVVELERGSLESTVPRQRRGEAYEVQGGGYRFRALGTRFRVALDPQTTRLDVSEGKVEVLKSGQRIALVSAGETWRGPEFANTEPSEPTAIADAGTLNDVPNASSSAVPQAQRANCLALAREGASKSAIACFEREARGSSLGAEVAQYELARLRRDVVGDLNGALNELYTYTRRFPQGTFNTEARLTIVQLLASLGRTSEALRNSDELIRSGSAKERTLELHLMRGKLLRRSGDCESANRELRAVIEAQSPLATEAQRLLDECGGALPNPGQ